jgi:hypothetical protein
VTDLDVIDILLVEGDPHDAELTKMARKKRNVANPLQLAEMNYRGV